MLPIRASRIVHSSRRRALPSLASVRHSRLSAQLSLPRARRSPSLVRPNLFNGRVSSLLLVRFSIRLLTRLSSPLLVRPSLQVTITIPDGASGDSIASILSENHIVENPKDYYAAVKKLNADMSLKPGDYSFTTLMDATKVVQQLMEGPNAGSNALTIPEGLTVDQVADRVAQAYDSISKEDFLNPAKASNYVDDYSFLKGAANDSLEGFLFPKT